MTRFASPETYLATPIQAFMPDSTDWGEYTTRLMQQKGMDEVNEQQGDLIRKQGDFQARQMTDRGQQIAAGIRQQGNQALIDGALSFGLGVASGGAKAGWFGGGGAGGFSVGDAKVMGMPTGQAEYIGGGGTTEWTTDMGLNSWTKY